MSNTNIIPAGNPENGMQAPPKKETGVQDIKSYLNRDDLKKRFEDILGRNAAAFITSVLQIVNSNKDLSIATRESIFNVAATAATLGLPLNNNLQFCHIIPYKDNKTGIVTAQCQIGWRGFVQLAQRTDKYKSLNVTDVRQGELKKKNRLTGEHVFEWIEDEDERNKLPVIGYASHFTLLSGFEKTVYWTVAKLQRHAARYSKTYNKQDGKWNTDFEAMSLKTVIKENLQKWGPLSIDMSAAIKADQAVIKGINGKEIEAEYPDNPIQDAEILDDEEAERIGREANEKQALEAQEALKRQIEGKK